MKLNEELKYVLGLRLILEI